MKSEKNDLLSCEVKGGYLLTVTDFLQDKSTNHKENVDKLKYIKNLRGKYGRRYLQ